MKFEAITLEGKKVIGIGVAESDKSYDSYVFGLKTGMKDDDYIYVKDLTDEYGESLSYLFMDSVSWMDGSEFEVSRFELVWTNSIKMIK